MAAEYIFETRWDNGTFTLGPQFSSPQDDPVLRQQEMLLRFEHNGFSYVVVSTNSPYAAERLVGGKVPKDPRGATPKILRYGYNNFTERLSSTFATLQCYRPAYSCGFDIQCQGAYPGLSRPTLTTNQAARALRLGHEGRIL